MNAPGCPDKETLFGYVVGTITEDVAEAVAQHLLACRVCEQTIEALEGLSDTVVSALRQAAPRDAYAEEPACQQVLQQLQALRVFVPDIDSPLATASRAPQPSLSHARLGDYELLKTLGQGGMGTVYQAQHVRLKRVVALKVLPQNRLGNTDAVARFEREIEAVGRLDHPHIVRALDAREVDGIRFLVMEHVDGLDLAEVVARCGPLSVADACEVIRQAALGLQCSEEHGLVHRDIKPSNLMLNAEGQIKVLDLGLAQFQEAEPLDSQVTGIGQLMGTPDYISPEQALESHSVDIRTDIYSLGGTLYYLLAGQPPFSGSQYDTPLKKVAGHLRDAVPPINVVRPDLPKPLVALLERMLAKNASQRVARPSDVVNALAPLCAGSKVIGLLREARAKAKQAEDEPSHQEAEEVQISAAAEFNPYHRWLGIAPAEQPADHYGLLGIPRFESDPEVIRDAATRQMAHVRTYHLGPHAELSQNILNELGMAKACLLDPQKKAAYDAECRKRQAAEVLEAPMPPAPPAPGKELAAFITDPDQSVEGSPAITPPHPRVASLRRPGAPGGRWIQQVIRGLQTPAGMAVVAAGFLTVFLLGVVIRVQTNYGTVKIEIPEGIANVELKLDRETISIEGLDHPLRLRPGAHELLVTARDYETVCTSFAVCRGHNPPLTVTWDAKTPEPPGPVAIPEPVPASVVEPIEKPAVSPVIPQPPPAPVYSQPTPQNLPTLQEILAGDPIPRIGPLVAQCRKAVQEQDWELAQQCSALLLAAARRGVQERTLAQVTLLCQGLRRDVRFAHNPPDAYIEPFLQGLDTPGAFAADVGPPKTAPPNPVDHDRISKEVQQNYGPEYRKTQTEQQKKVFAEGILNAARSTTDPRDPATRCMLLEWVSHLAAEAKDWDLGGEAIEARAAEFQDVDVLAEQWQLCNALASVIKDPQEQRRLARQLLSFAHVALDEDRLELAQQCLGEAKRVALRAKDRGFTAEVQPIDKLMETIASERQLAQSAIRALERDPLDAAANEQVGRFYCLTMGQWNRGLPWLALGSDQRLRDLAVQELGLLVDPTQLPPPVALRRKLAEDWAAVAESETGRARGMALGRAYRWYREVRRDVTGPDKNIVNKLLRDMRETGDLILSAPDDAKPYCGHFYKAFPTPMPWHIASHECAELGGHLARLESLWEHRFVWQLVSGPDLWRVDGSDVLAEGVWIFGNGEPPTFTKWEQGQPDNGGWMFSEHSVAIFPPNGNWIDLESDARTYFICEWDGRLMRVLPTEKTPPIRRPPRNAAAFGGHHYLLFEQPQIPWHVAQDFCARQGGHLARIQSPEEFEFVKTLIAQTKSTVFWIDGNDEECEGVWVDADGEPLTYLPWPPGCPSNDLGNENVAEIRDGKFNDMRCGLRQGGFICEWDR